MIIKSYMLTEGVLGSNLRAEKGVLRQIVMDLLYRVGGLKGPEIGRLFGIDYGPVSQERKRLREKLPKDCATCTWVTF